MDIKDKENETEEIEEKPESLLKRRKIRRVMDLDEDDHLEQILVRLPKKQLDRLKQEALDRGVSRASLIRGLIKKQYPDIEKTISSSEKPSSEQETETPIPDEDLLELLGACESFFGGFRVTESNGFFSLFAQREWKLKDLTDSQFCVVMNHLKVGYDGFLEKPDILTFLGWIGDLEASDDQLKLASSVIRHDLTIIEFDETDTLYNLNSEIEGQYGSEEDIEEKLENEEEKEATGEKALEESEKPSETESSEKPYWKLPE